MVSCRRIQIRWCSCGDVVRIVSVGVVTVVVTMVVTMMVIELNWVEVRQVDGNVAEHRNRTTE